VYFLIKKTGAFAFEILRGSVTSLVRPCDVIVTCEKISNASFPKKVHENPILWYLVLLFNATCRRVMV